MWNTVELLGGVLIVIGMVGYSALMPRPSTPRGSWLLRSVAASSLAAVSVLAAVLLWSTGAGNGVGEAWVALASVCPYVLGGSIVLAVGTYLKIHLWAAKNDAAKRWLSGR